MLPISLAAAIVAATLAANVALDVGINTLQNWYDTVYGDAFWSKRVKDSPALRALAVEEAEINQLMDADFADEPKVNEPKAK
jgi:hypothetical protein